MPFAIRYVTTKGEVDNKRLSKWHYTEYGGETLCGRKISYNGNNQKNDDIDIVDCGQCIRSMELDNIG